NCALALGLPRGLIEAGRLAIGRNDTTASVNIAVWVETKCHKFELEWGNRPLLAIAGLGADKLAVRGAAGQRVDVGEHPLHEIGAPLPGGGPAKSAFRVLAVVMNRGHQGAGLLANRAHNVADLGRFGVVVLVLHTEGSCNRVDDDLTEPRPK